MAYKVNGIQVGVKRKVFISHYKGDKIEVDDFIKKFCNDEGVFIPKVLGANDNDDFINSSNTDYVMNQIRKKYLQDSTVTIVLVGSCTHSRRYIDWELKSSLRQGEYTPNGVVGIVLPSQNNSAYLPSRLQKNWKKGNLNCYAKYQAYPLSAKILHDYIEDAYESRTSRNHLILNSQDMMSYSKKCLVCGVTH